MKKERIRRREKGDSSRGRRERNRWREVWVELREITRRRR
jgi:hypothetical protein